jgi:hypothetical protein
MKTALAREEIPMYRQSHASLIAGFSFLFAAAMMAYARPAAATVTWDFLETSLTFSNLTGQPGGPPVPGFVPHVAGTLTMSDADFLERGAFWRNKDRIAES